MTWLFVILVAVTRPQLSSREATHLLGRGERIFSAFTCSPWRFSAIRQNAQSRYLLTQNADCIPPARLFMHALSCEKLMWNHFDFNIVIHVAHQPDNLRQEIFVRLLAITHDFVSPVSLSPRVVLCLSPTRSSTRLRFFANLDAFSACSFVLIFQHPSMAFFCDRRS